MDSQLGRLSTFTGAEFVESLDLGDTRHLYLHGVDNTTGALLLGMPLAVVMGRRYDTPFSSVPLVKLDRAAATTDRIGSADWDQSISTGGGNNPFMSGGFLTVSSGDFVVGRGDRPELRWIDQAGRLRQVVRWNAQTTPVPDSLIAAWERRTRIFFEEAGLAQVDIEFRLTSMREAIQEPLPLFGIPGPMPPAGGLLADPTGLVWIAEYRARNQDRPQRYHLVSAEGEWLGSLDAPDGVRVLSIHENYLAGVRRNALDEEAFCLFGIQR